MIQVNKNPKNCIVKTELGQNPNTKISILQELAKDNNKYFRYFIAEFGYGLIDNLLLQQSPASDRIKKVQL